MINAMAVTLDPSAICANDDRITTTSFKVAESFGKQHKNVIQKIEGLDCSAAFASANFSAHVQNVCIGNNATRESKTYQMTKDGFMFLVMGFTGKKAAAVKEAYINAFNDMQQQIDQAKYHVPAADLEEKILDTFADGQPWISANISNAARLAGIPVKNNRDRREIGRILREHFGEPSPAQGQMRFKLPFPTGKSQAEVFALPGVVRSRTDSQSFGPVPGTDSRLQDLADELRDTRDRLQEFRQGLQDLTLAAERDRDAFALIQSGIETTIEAGTVDESLLIAIVSLP